MSDEFDAVIVGAGPNGLTAAAMLARAGQSVLVLEGGSTAGGGARTDEAFGAGIRRDVCSAVHPTGLASPAFADLDLTSYGLDWLVPDVSVMHAFGPGESLAMWRDRAALAVELGVDGRHWARSVGLIGSCPGLVDDVLSMPAVPRNRAAMARFSALAGLPTEVLVRLLQTPAVRTAFAGIAAHASRPTTSLGSVAPGLLLGGLVSSGWPVARGGSQAISDALARIVVDHGGSVETDCPVEDFAVLPKASAVLFDVSPRALVPIMGDRLPAGYARRLRRFRYGPGTCKVDFVLREPIPWGDERFAQTATFHIAEDLAQVRATESDVAAGRIPLQPWVLGGEPTRVDPSRAPEGVHLAWAYCHVPAGCDSDVSNRIVAQIERCAPGFRDVIVDRSVTTAADLEAYNPNNVGGDIGCGATSLKQLLARPTASPDPSSTPVDGVYLCSAATAPGGGVHGMSGYRAARRVLGAS
ncbi:MAG: NAD(P)/FAD-dependent oxidoreductase [Gordonia sp. (in: high G+C Gram-positive bacteria)]